MTIRLEAFYGIAYLVTAQGESRLIQSQDDFPNLACAFGWNGQGSPRDFLDDHIGEEADDPGYL